VSVQFYALWGPEADPRLGEAVYCNTANGNALLRLLGYQPSPDGGEDDPEEFLARVRRAKIRVGNTTGADAGMEMSQGRGALGARWIDCGRRPGYFAERLPDLEKVGQEARRHGGRVCWA
jgi:hypothetical protein